MWARSESSRKNMERISKSEIHPGTVHVAVPGCFSFGKSVFTSLLILFPLPYKMLQTVW